MYLNKVTIYGRLGRDPELKSLPSGIKVVSFSLATTESYKDKTSGEKKEVTDWHNLVCFGKRAEVIAQWVHKGDMLFVEGKLKTRSWEKDGVKQYRTEVNIDDFKFGESNRGGGAPSSQSASTTPKAATPVAKQAPQAAPPADKLDTIEYPEEEINPDDIPF